MRWEEFRDLLAGLSADTALGRVVAIRAEDDPEVLKRFTPQQRAMRAAWHNRMAHQRSAEDTAQFIATLQQAFARMAGGGGR